MLKQSRIMTIPPVFSVRHRAPAAAAAAAAWYVVAGKTCVAAYQPKGAASLAASYVNLANPGTYDAAPGVAPTWDATNGWKFNGLTQYLTTGYNPVSTVSVIIRFSGVSAGGYKCFIGMISGAFDVVILHVWGGVHYWWHHDLQGVVGDKLNGVLAVTPNGGYDAGVLKKALTGETVNASHPFLIGCYSSNGTPEYYSDGYVQAVAIYAVSLTDGEVATVSAAMAAL